MHYRLGISIGVGAVGSLWLAASPAAAGIYASSVVSYSSGDVQDSYLDFDGTYTNPSGALGLPDSSQNLNLSSYTDDGIINPFNAQYNTAQVVAISGSSGSLVLKLNSPIMVGNGAALGVHSGAGLEDVSPDFSGGNSSPAQNYTDPRSADLWVGQQTPSGIDWVELHDQSFNNPTNIYTDVSGPYTSTPGTQLADVYKPFYGSLSDFDGKNFANTIAALNGSAGGNWFNLSGVDLTEIDDVKFTTADGETMYVDSVVGVSAVPEPVMVGPVLLAAAAVLMRRQKRIPCNAS